MPVRLRPVRDEELAEYLASVRAGYTRGLIEEAGLAPEEARVKTERDFVSLTPEGHVLEGHHFFVVEDADSDTSVGHLWLAERTVNERRLLFVYDVLIEEEFRGRGYGKEAMLLAEEKARELGLTELALNVFGGNAVARSLYSSLGYRERMVAMVKRLDEEP